MTCSQAVLCPGCDSNDIVKSGHTRQGKQRYLCREPGCMTKTFLLNYQYNACKPGIADQVIDMAINSSGIRDTARVLHINKNTVIRILKKKNPA